MPSFDLLRNQGKSVGWAYMREVYELDDQYYLVDFDNEFFEPVVTKFAMPSYELLQVLGEAVDYVPLDGIELIKFEGLIFKIRQVDQSKLEISIA